jgi:ketosteroid isomerase-like protein
MRLNVLIPLSLLLVSASPYEDRRAVEELTAVERAFAADAQTMGVWPAFSKYITDDGIMFRPGAVNGKAWLAAADPYPGILDWWPTFVEVSCDGRLGWSTGPVTTKEPRIVSHYVTIWGKQPDGQWRFVLDYGNPHVPTPVERHRMAPVNSVPNDCGNAPDIDVDQVTPSLFAADDKLSAGVARDNRPAYRASYAAHVRFHRFGKPPVLGRDAALSALESEPRTYTTKRLGGGAAASGDLGYTYGDIVWREPVRGDQKGIYLRIWRREGAQWKLALDHMRPLTPPPPPAG